MKFYIRRITDNDTDIALVWDNDQTWAALLKDGTWAGSTWAPDWAMNENEILITADEALNIISQGGPSLRPGDLTPEQMKAWQNVSFYKSVKFCPKCSEWFDNWKWIDQPAQIWRCSNCNAVLPDVLMHHNLP